MNLTVQGNPHAYEGAPDVKSLLEALHETVLYVTVRLNGEILHRRDFENIPLTEGDSVDFLYFLGGGMELADTRSYV